jgi:hypothetical protein
LEARIRKFAQRDAARRHLIPLAHPKVESSSKVSGFKGDENQARDKRVQIEAAIEAIG